jgi:hypothetical protein
MDLSRGEVCCVFSMEAKCISVFSFVEGSLAGLRRLRMCRVRPSVLYHRIG